MTAADQANTILPEDALAAAALALVGAANDATAVKVIQAIIDAYGVFDDKRTEPTKILIDAIHEAGGSFTT